MDVGTIVRHTQSTLSVNRDAIGKVTGTHLGWPVVYFPWGTFGPYSEYVIAPRNLDTVDVDTLTRRERTALGV